MPGHVERDHRRQRDADRRRVDREQAPVGRHQQRVGGERVGDAGDRADEQIIGVRDHASRWCTPGAVENGTASAAVRSPAGQRADEVVDVVARQQRRGRDDRAAEERHRRDRTTQLLQHDGGLAVADAPAPPSFSGTISPARPRSIASARHRPTSYVSAVSMRDSTRLAGAARGEQRAHGRAQVLLDLGVEQVGHFGRSFQATSLSMRGSDGSPSTRSAMMLRRISEVPPSIELPFARR